jgi:hypothetical protein
LAAATVSTISCVPSVLPPSAITIFMSSRSADGLNRSISASICFASLRQGITTMHGMTGKPSVALCLLV